MLPRQPLSTRVQNWLLQGTFIKVALAAWLVFIGAIIVAPYPQYMPPDFRLGFLAGRQEYFWGLYALGFYLHIVSAPPVLLLGIAQTSRQLRRRFIWLHQRLGWLYCILILAAMAPGGLILSLKALGGWQAACGFAMLSLLTWWFTYRGWQSIDHGRPSAHGRWMLRSFVLVCSAVLLRVLSAEAGRWGLDPQSAYQASAWLSWLLPWMIIELYWVIRSRRQTISERN